MALRCPTQVSNGIRATISEWVSQIPKLRVWQCLDLIFESFTVLNRLTWSHKKNHSNHLAASQIHEEELHNTLQSPNKAYYVFWAAVTDFLGEFYVSPEILWPFDIFLHCSCHLTTFKPVHFLWAWTNWAKRQSTAL